MSAMWAFFFLVQVVTASDKDRPSDNSEFQKLKGTWSVTRQEWGEYDLVKDTLLHVSRLEIDGETCIMTCREMAQSPEETLTLKLLPDATRDPAHLDFASSEGKSKLKGIYKLTDKDTLVIAIGMEEGVRPKGFDANKEFLVVMTLARIKGNRSPTGHE